MTKKTTIAKTSFITLFRLLEKSEVPLFLKYIEKKHRRTNHIKLFIKVLSGHSDEKYDIDKVFLFKKVFKSTFRDNKVANDRINNLLRQAKNELKEFLIEDWSNKEKEAISEVHFPWLHTLHFRKTPFELFEKELENIRKKQEFPIKNIIYFKREKELISLLTAHYIKHKAKPKDDYANELQKKAVIYSFYLFTIDALMNYCSIQIRFRETRTETHTWNYQPIQFILTHFSSQSIDTSESHTFVAKLWYYLTYLLQDNHHNNKKYDISLKAKDKINQYLSKVKNIKNEKRKKEYLDELRQAYRILTVYYIRQTRGEGTIDKEDVTHKKAWEKLFETYKEQVENNIIFSNGSSIHPQEFTNIISIALRLKEYKWAENFKTDHEPKLNNEDRDNTILYCDILINFYQKKYNKCINIINILMSKSQHTASTKADTKDKEDVITKDDVKNKRILKDITYKNRLRIFLIKSYYESSRKLHLDKISKLDEELDHFRRHLDDMNRKEHLDIDHIQRHRNFISIVKRLSKFRLAYRHIDKAQYEALKKKIQDMKILTELVWLEEKIEELNK